MADTKPFLSQTAQTAVFALQEYFRPLVVAGRFLKSWLVPAEPTESAASTSRSFRALHEKRRRSLITVYSHTPGGMSVSAEAWLLLVLSALEEEREQTPKEIKEKLGIHPDESQNPQIDSRLNKLVSKGLVEHPGGWKRTKQGSDVCRQLQQTLIQHFN